MHHRLPLLLVLAVSLGCVVPRASGSRASDACVAIGKGDAGFAAVAVSEVHAAARCEARVVAWAHEYARDAAATHGWRSTPRGVVRELARCTRGVGVGDAAAGFTLDPGARNGAVCRAPSARVAEGNVDPGNVVGCQLDMIAQRAGADFPGWLDRGTMKKGLSRLAAAVVSAFPSADDAVFDWVSPLRTLTTCAGRRLPHDGITPVLFALLDSLHRLAPRVVRETMSARLAVVRNARESVRFDRLVVIVKTAHGGDDLVVDLQETGEDRCVVFEARRYFTGGVFPVILIDGHGAVYRVVAPLAPARPKSCGLAARTRLQTDLQRWAECRPPSAQQQQQQCSPVAGLPRGEAARVNPESCAAVNLMYGHREPVGMRRTTPTVAWAVNTCRCARFPTLVPGPDGGADDYRVRALAGLDVEDILLQSTPGYLHRPPQRSGTASDDDNGNPDCREVPVNARPMSATTQRPPSATIHRPPSTTIHRPPSAVSNGAPGTTIYSLQSVVSNRPPGTTYWPFQTAATGSDIRHRPSSAAVIVRDIAAAPTEDLSTPEGRTQLYKRLAHEARQRERLHKHRTETLRRRREWRHRVHKGRMAKVRHDRAQRKRRRSAGK